MTKQREKVQGGKVNINLLQPFERARLSGRNESFVKSWHASVPSVPIL